ncbi:hypothetical protein Bbelb_015230 [Branchiostoma belcheri]|nr:hypothetical protein Bbelb_015230 [Branchiostoma belcheri]
MQHLQLPSIYTRKFTSLLLLANIHLQTKLVLKDPAICGPYVALGQDLSLPIRISLTTLCAADKAQCAGGGYLKINLTRQEDGSRPSPGQQASEACGMIYVD